MIGDDRISLADGPGQWSPPPSRVDVPGFAAVQTIGYVFPMRTVALRS